MDFSQTSRSSRSLNLPNKRDASVKNAKEDKSDQLIKSTFNLLERGEKEIKFDDKHRDVILILGNTGSGKSTFTQWLAGDNTKMISKETKEGTGEYIINDNNRIGNNTLKSKTIFPELVVDAKTNAAYYDCPGFSDTEGTSHDISTTYFIKKVIDFSKSVKMVFSISHPSVRKGVDRQDFMKLVRHVTDLVKDIEKFKNSIAFVATKVDNQYIKQGTNFILVEDIKVISAIADFLQEAKQYLEDSSKRLNLSQKENQFYENAMKFVEVLLEKEGDIYPKIGIFRRPDEPGPISDIPLLQKGKYDIERILYEKLDFSSKSNEDFGYTVSDKTKNDINVIIEEINKNLWSSLSDIAEKIQEYHRNLVNEIREKIRLFVSGQNAVEVNSSEAEAFRNKFSSGYNITSDVVNKMRNLTDPEQLAVIINSTISNLDIDVSNDDLLNIANQGKYFSFLQTVSDKELNLKPYDQLFKVVEMFFSSSKALLFHDVNSSAEKINNRLKSNLNNITKGIREQYLEKIKCFDIKNLPDKLNQKSRILLKFTKEMKNELTTESLLGSIRYVVNDLGVSLPIQNLQKIENQLKRLKFLDVVGDGTLNVDPNLWLSSFENIAQYFYESGKWYTFLEDLYNRFSEHEIQKDREKYNVADLEDWNQSRKPQGIFVTPKTFKTFLNNIRYYNVSEYETIKTLTTTTNLQIEELNEVLSLTLNHRPTVICSEPNVIIKGSFISLKETMQKIADNSDTNNSCKNFKSLLEAGKYKLLKIFALNKVFIDSDLSFSGKQISVVIIAPNWEVVGSRSIDISGAEGAAHLQSKAKNGANPGNSGYPGAPGNPGGPGENFFGIGSTFVGGAKLKIISAGGKGGSGQDGGDGIPGMLGKDPVIPAENDPPCKLYRFREFSCAEVSTERKVDYWHITCVTTVHITGLAGKAGGHGGRGGKGGNGGYPGNIEVLELGGPSRIMKITPNGKPGENGKGGIGGKGVRNGDTIIADFRSETIRSCMWACETTKWIFKRWIYNGLSLAGNNGSDGGNPWGLQDPVQGDGISTLPNLINEYKIYLRENIKNRFIKSSLIQFLEQLISNNDVRNLYDTLALFEEFEGFEEQFNKISKYMDYSFFYSSLLNRITNLVNNQKDEPNLMENKKALNYLYTTALGRIYNLRGNSEFVLIIDVHGHLNLVQENIKTLKDLQTMNSKVDVINKYKANYKKGIDNKIEEAKTFIKKQISPDIEKIKTDIDDQVNFLIEETICLQNKAEKDWEKLAEKKRELENAVAMTGLFNFFRIIGGIVSFMGPLGAIAGTVIETTTTVGESLALNNQQKVLKLPSDIISAITTVGNQIKEMKNKKVAYLNNLLDDLTQEIKKNPDTLSDMTRKINDIKEKLKKACEKKLDFKQVKMVESELKGELKRKGDDLKIRFNDKESVDALKVIGRINQIAQLGSLLHNVYGKMKEDKEKINTLTEAMEKIEDKIKKLREYEENIYDTIVPMLQEMEEQMKDISDKLGSKSQVALDITKWRVQSSLKDMILQMRHLTEGFEVKNYLSHSIEKLAEVMTTLINIYDRIQSYQDQQNLANYIADISSVAANNINIKDEQLQNAVNNLEFAIRANIVLQQYNSAIDAFKQWVFPFADHYMEKSILPYQLKLDQNIQNLVQNATREIETIKKKLDLYNISVKNSDKYLQCEEFSSQYVSSHPFFVWTKEEYGSLISNLLSGKEVVFKTDIRDSVPDKEAIKFTEIEFEFKTKNKTAQSELSEILKGFDIKATHLGNSYYRFANEVFLITSDSVTISYSFEKNEDGIPIRSNNVYNKVKSGDLLLSPYTLWEVTMIKKTKQHYFQDLEKYKNDINIELSGFGSYVDSNVFIPAAAVYNSSNLQLLGSKVSGINQCKRSKHRLVRSVEEIMVEDHMTNGASVGMPSPINFLCNILKTYFTSNAIISVIQRNYARSFESSYERSEKINISSNVKTKPPITDTVKIDTSTEDYYEQLRNVPKSDPLFITNFDSNNRCSKSFLLSDQKGRNNNQSIQVADLNCSLLLADLVSRKISGNKYKSPIDECLMSPPEIILDKISNGVVRRESDIKQILQSYVSEEERPNSWFNKIRGYGKSVLQYLGLFINDDTEEYIQDIRELYS